MVILRWYFKANTQSLKIENALNTLFVLKAFSTVISWDGKRLGDKEDRAQFSEQTEQIFSVYWILLRPLHKCPAPSIVTFDINILLEAEYSDDLLTNLIYKLALNSTSFTTDLFHHMTWSAGLCTVSRASIIPSNLVWLLDLGANAVRSF